MEASLRGRGIAKEILKAVVTKIGQKQVGGGGNKIKLDLCGYDPISNSRFKHTSAVARSLGSLLSSM